MLRFLEAKEATMSTIEEEMPREGGQLKRRSVVKPRSEG